MCCNKASQLILVCMCVYVYVCICICMCVCECMCMCVCVWICMYMYVYVCVCECICMCMSVYLCVYVCVCVYVYILAAPSIRCSAGAFLVLQWADVGYSLIVVCRLLIALASLVMEHGLCGARASVVAAWGLQSTGSVAVAHGVSCPTACGIFLDQGSNSCLLHWQADSLPLSHQGSPPYVLVKVLVISVVSDSLWPFGL